MNFFEYQDRARKNTQQLIGLFVLSVLVIISAIYLVAAIIFGGVSVGGSGSGTSYQTEPGVLSRDCLQRVATYSGKKIAVENDSRDRPARVISLEPGSEGADVTQEVCPTTASSVQSRSTSAPGFWNPALFLTIAFPTILLIGGGSLYKIQSLKQGGQVIAEELGGRLIVPEQATLQEKQLLNVVEEMAIASGVSVPPVYVLEHEAGINAFAAGFTPNDAVIGVTQGCIEILDRDELQGVIGHEFSHILNGDMRLNLHLVGLLHGLLLIYITGRILLDSRPRHRSRDNNNDGDKLALFGLALVVIGWIGWLCGAMIKSAVSRQREFLADASSVQFTRNPSGLAGALHKIVGHSHRSFLQAPQAEVHSHMFFGNALMSNFMGDWLATHPPAEQRIQRLKAQAGASYKATPFQTSPGSVSAAVSDTNPLISGLVEAGAAASMQVTPAQVVQQVGTVTPEHFAYAQGFVAQLPESLQQAIRERSSAIAIAYALLLNDPDSPGRGKQLEWLRQVEAPEVVDRTMELSVVLYQLDPRSLLPLLDLAIPVFRQSSTADCQRLLKICQGLAVADQRLSLSKFVVQIILWHRLRPRTEATVEQSQQYDTLDSIWSDCVVVISAIARVGHTKDDVVTYAFRSGLSRLPGAGKQTTPAAPIAINPRDFKVSLDRLAVASPKLKQSIVDACAHTVLLDNTVTVQEGNLLRAVAIALDCPLPPFLQAPTKKVKSSANNKN